MSAAKHTSFQKNLRLNFCLHQSGIYNNKFNSYQLHLKVRVCVKGFSTTLFEKIFCAAEFFCLRQYFFVDLTEIIFQELIRRHI
jgi:uncharacterized Fe-S cluster-containing radical SAM superfamily protein